VRALGGEHTEETVTGPAEEEAKGAAEEWKGDAKLGAAEERSEARPLSGGRSGVVAGAGAGLLLLESPLEVPSLCPPPTGSLGGGTLRWRACWIREEEAGAVEEAVVKLEVEENGSTDAAADGVCGTGVGSAAAAGRGSDAGGGRLACKGIDGEICMPGGACSRTFDLPAAVDVTAVDPEAAFDTGHEHPVFRGWGLFSLSAPFAQPRFCCWSSVTRTA